VFIRQVLGGAAVNALVYRLVAVNYTDPHLEVEVLRSHQAMMPTDASDVDAIAGVIEDCSSMPSHFAVECHGGI
jgi:hypothetical protein